MCGTPSSVVVHNDEGVPHIHAFIVPIDDRGHLNSNYYFGGRSKLVEMQNSYAKAMSKFGLERGEYKSIATPEKVARYLTEITKATDATLPPPEKDETKEEYYERANRILQNVKIHHRDEIVKQNQENIRARSEMIQRFEASHEDSWENKKKLRKLAKSFGLDEITEEDIEKIAELKAELDALAKAVEECPDADLKEWIMEEKERLMKEDERKKKRKSKDGVGR